MSMTTTTAINGYVAADPRLTFTEEGRARLYMRVGINHFERLDDGAFRKLEPTYHDLVQFGPAAELSYERFRRGDDIVAQGHVREYTRTVDGDERTDEQFLAKRVVHDPNTTTYEVQRRSPRTGERESADRDGMAADSEHATPSAADRVAAAPAERASGTAEAVSPPPPPPQPASR